MNSDNRRIAKNTIYLYIRMLITVVVSLYTSRVVMDVLGLSDYGLYNVVGGTLTLFSFVNSALSGCTQRYLNIAIGEGNEQKTKNVFSVAFTIHTFLSAFFFILMLIIGWVMISNVLVIEEGRTVAAYWILLFSLISVCTTFSYLPFDAAIVAHEKMDFYAVISILEAILKLAVVYLLFFHGSIDKVILYAILNCCATFIIAFLYYFYCKNRFVECRLSFRFDLGIIKEMASFTGWNMLGNLTFMISTQGVNVVLNMFFGTVINAAWSVATQVNAVISRFSGGVQTAASPQIMKLCASKDHSAMYTLAQNTSKYVVYLMFFICVPAFLEIDYVLSVWLVDVPAHASFFVRVMIIISIITASQFPLSRIIVATGRIKASCVFNLVIQVAAVIVSYIILLTSKSLQWAMIVQIIPAIVGYLFMLHLVQNYIGVNAMDYFPYVILKNIIVLIPSVILPVIAHFFMEEGIIRVIIVTLVCVVSVSTCVYYLGIDTEVRSRIKLCIVNKIHNIWRIM